ncbi:MAG: 6-phosphogluconolactonase [Acidobacteriota bacterium]|jgi:6-phosphogluconolactonase|nr:6-phosphogluconolactonase [Acidobacteriota bacterium]
MKDKSFTRREFINAAGVGVTGLALSTPFEARATVAHATRELLVYVGTYTQGRSEGVYLLRLSLASGELKLVGSTHGVVNPSYLTLDVRRRFLYAVNEVEEFAGRKSGAVSAFAVDQRTGALRFLNQQPSRGGAPCYVTADGSGRFVLVANYVGGNVAVLPVLKDGTLGAATDVKQHQGSGANRERQEGPHAHCIVLDRANRYAYSCDLGTDKVMVYRFDARGGRLTPNEPPAAPMPPGAGPRHLTFHPGGKFAYVLNELNSTVTAFAQDRARGTLKELQTIGTLPAGFAGANTAADIHATPDGRFLYCSNRGHDSIAAFGVDATTGGLRPIGHTPTAGKTPRNFAIDPTGTYLLAANQNSDTIVTFRIDPPTGTLQPTGHTAEVPSPVCLKLTTPFS